LNLEPKQKPERDSAEPAPAKSHRQLLDCFKLRAKKDRNTEEPAKDEQNARKLKRKESEEEGDQESLEETKTSKLQPDAEINELGQAAQPEGPVQPEIGEPAPADPEIKKTDTRETKLQSVVVKFVNRRDKIGRTALHYIAEDGCVEILDKLLNWFTVQHVRSKVRVNVRDFYGFAPLHLAVLKGHKQMVERLLEATKTDARFTVGAPPTAKPELMEWNEKHLEMCRPNLFSKEPETKYLKEGLTALRLAAMGGHTKIADLLLNWKPPKEEGDQTPVGVAGEDQGELQLSFASSTDNGHLDVATLLLRHITEEKQLDNAFEKMLALAMKTTDKDVSEVLKKSKQVDGITNIFERLLIVAADVNVPDVIRNIFNWEPEVNVNVEALWKDGSNLRATPLHFAVLRGHVDIVRQLLSHKSLDVNAEDSKHRTPLQIAVEGDLSRNADGEKIKMKEKWKRIEKLLMERAEVKDLVEKSYRDREVFINAVNALLVGAALIATVTFAGWLTPPLGLTPYVAPEPSPATSPHYISLPHPTSVKVFWVSNSLSFFLAIATVLICAFAAMPSLKHTYIREAVKSLRTTLIVASMFFLFSVFFVLGAFASAGFAVLPSPHLNYKLSMKLTVAIGGFFCSCCLVVLMWILSRLSYEYPCGCLSSLCQTLRSKICAFGGFHGEETSSKDRQLSTPLTSAPLPEQDGSVKPHNCAFPTFSNSMILRYMHQIVCCLPKSILLSYWFTISYGYYRQ
jgi:ankyrin repeat protein/membrane associated rhomboid family serine protease